MGKGKKKKPATGAGGDDDAVLAAAMEQNVSLAAAATTAAAAMAERDNMMSAKVRANQPHFVVECKNKLTAKAGKVAGELLNALPSDLMAVGAYEDGTLQVFPHSRDHVLPEDPALLIAAAPTGHHHYGTVCVKGTQPDGLEALGFTMGRSRMALVWEKAEAQTVSFPAKIYKGGKDGSIEIKTCSPSASPAAGKGGGKKQDSGSSSSACEISFAELAAQSVEQMGAFRMPREYLVDIVITGTSGPEAEESQWSWTYSHGPPPAASAAAGPSVWCYKCATVEGVEEAQYQLEAHSRLMEAYSAAAFAGDLMTLLVLAEDAKKVAMKTESTEVVLEFAKCTSALAQLLRAKIGDVPHMAQEAAAVSYDAGQAFAALGMFPDAAAAYKVGAEACCVRGGIISPIMVGHTHNSLGVALKKAGLADMSLRAYQWAMTSVCPMNDMICEGRAGQQFKELPEQLFKNVRELFTQCYDRDTKAAEAAQQAGQAKSMMQQAEAEMANMSPEQMKQMTEMASKMDPKMMAMAGGDQNIMKMAQQQMANMSAEQMKQVTEMASKMDPKMMAEMAAQMDPKQVTEMASSMGGPQVTEDQIKQQTDSMMAMSAEAASEEKEHACSKCQTKGAKNECSGCQAVWYCSKKCQKADWKRHKAVCTKANELD